MPYAENHGVRIYYEVEGEGPPLVMGHGMGEGANLNAWRSTGYTDELKKDYTLILFDFRGFGKSDKPKRDATSRFSTADDIVAILDSLDIYQAHYLGYSMGASAGFKLAVNYPDRFLSFMLGGMTPGKWPQEMIQAVKLSADLAKLRRVDPEAYFKEMERLLGHPLNEPDRKELLAKDSGGGSNEQTVEHESPGLSDEDLERITVPCLLYCGDQDPFSKGAQEAVQPMPRGIFVSLDGLNHVTAFYRSDVIVPLAKQFLTIVTKNMPEQG